MYEDVKKHGYKLNEIDQIVNWEIPPNTNTSLQK
jgi:hypothetical protein